MKNANSFLRFPVIAIAIFSLCILSCGNPEREAADKRYDDSVNKADSLVKFGPPVSIDASRINDTSLNGKRVVIEGYVRIGNSTFNYKENASFELFARKGEFKPTSSTLRISLPPGEEKNNMKRLPESYSYEDVEVTGNAGEKIHYGDKVKITGMLSNGIGVYLDAQVIEKIADAPFDYSASAMRVTSANFNDTAMNEKLVFTEGYLSYPGKALTGKYEHTYFTMHADSIEKEFTVDILYGSDASNVIPFDPKSGQSAIRILDRNKVPVDFSKKVRIYGTWSNTEGVNERYITMSAEYIEQL